MHEAAPRALALLALAGALALIPDLVDRWGRSQSAPCRSAAARCAWLAGKRPALERATASDLAQVPGFGPDAAAQVARALRAGSCLATWDEVEQTVGPLHRRALEPFFWAGCANRDRGDGDGEDGT